MGIGDIVRLKYTKSSMFVDYMHAGRKIGMIVEEIPEEDSFVVYWTSGLVTRTRKKDLYIAKSSDKILDI